MVSGLCVLLFHQVRNYLVCMARIHQVQSWDPEEQRREKTHEKYESGELPKGDYGFSNSQFTVAYLQEFFYLKCWNNTTSVLIKFKTAGVVLHRQNQRNNQGCGLKIRSIIYLLFFYLPYIDVKGYISPLDVYSYPLGFIYASGSKYKLYYFPLLLEQRIAVTYIILHIFFPMQCLVYNIMLFNSLHTILLYECTIVNLVHPLLDI